MVFLKPSNIKKDKISTDTAIAMLAVPTLIIIDENVWFLVCWIFFAKYNAIFI
jgi:hypothetical protein